MSTEKNIKRVYFIKGDNQKWKQNFSQKIRKGVTVSKSLTSCLPVEYNNIKNGESFFKNLKIRILPI